MSLADLTKEQKQTIMFGSIGIVVVVVLILIGVRFSQTSISSAKLELADLSGKIERAEQALAKKGRTGDDFERTASILEVHLKNAPPARNYYSWASEIIYSKARGSGMQIKSVDELDSTQKIKNTRKEPELSFKTYSLRIAASGDYEQVKQFILDIEKDHPLVRFTGLEISATSGADAHDVQLFIQWPSNLGEIKKQWEVVRSNQSKATKKRVAKSVPAVKKEVAIVAPKPVVKSVPKVEQPAPVVAAVTKPKPVVIPKAAPVVKKPAPVVAPEPVVKSVPKVKEPAPVIAAVTKPKPVVIPKAAPVVKKPAPVVAPEPVVKSVPKVEQPAPVVATVTKPKPVVVPKPAPVVKKSAPIIAPEPVIKSVPKVEQSAPVVVAQIEAPTSKEPAPPAQEETFGSLLASLGSRGEEVAVPEKAETPSSNPEDLETFLQQMKEEPVSVIEAPAPELEPEPVLDVPEPAVATLEPELAVEAWSEPVSQPEADRLVQYISSSKSAKILTELLTKDERKSSSSFNSFLDGMVEDN